MRRLSLVLIAVLALSSAVAVFTAGRRGEIPRPTMQESGVNVTVSSGYGLINVNGSEFRYIALDLESLGPYPRDSFVLRFMGVEFHYVPLLTTGCRGYKFVVSFSDGSEEELTLYLCPPGFSPSAPPILVSLSAHEDPRAGLYLNRSEGLIYLLVSWRQEVKPKVSEQNDLWVVSMELNATELKQNDSLRIYLYLRAKEDVKLKCLTNPPFSIEIKDVYGFTLWRFYPRRFACATSALSPGNS